MSFFTYLKTDHWNWSYWFHKFLFFFQKIHWTYEIIGTSGYSLTSKTDTFVTNHKEEKKQGSSGTTKAVTEVSTRDRALAWQLELKVSKSFHCFGVKACPNIKTRTMKIFFTAAVWEKCVYEKKTKEKLGAKFNKYSYLCNLPSSLEIYRK